MPYSSSLTDEEWKILEPLLTDILPPKKQTRPANWTKRELLDGIFYQLKNGAHLGRFAERPTALFDSVLAFLAVAQSWVNREADECVTWTSARRREKKPNGQR